MILSFFFFFQAEDGIRDKLVTGVQTCALPIWRRPFALLLPGGNGMMAGPAERASPLEEAVRRRVGETRSEERRVGKEGRSRWSPDHLKKKKWKSDET